MYLKSLDIENLMCFQKFHVEFKRGISVIIGRNGAGKTSILKSIVYALNFAFTTDKELGDDMLTAGNPDLKIKVFDYNEFYRKDQKSLPATSANIHAEMELGHSDLTWDMYKRSTADSSVYPSKYKEAYQHFMSEYKESDRLPVFAYFSDSFPHKLANISKFASSQISSRDNILRNFGYYQWDKENACTSIWERRLVNSILTDIQLNDENQYIHNEVKYITNSLRTISEPIDEGCDDSFVIEKVFAALSDKQEAELWLKLHDGTEILFDELPAGYRRLYSIALDLAYRAYILNASDEFAPGNVEGIALIDEIDLHLHPSLAQEVLQRFQKLFPKIQFITTTHSPIILSNLRSEDGKNSVLRVVKGEDAPHTLPDLFGIDYNTTLINALGTNRDQRIEQIKRSILRAMRNDQQRIVDAKKRELKTLIKSDDDYQQIMDEIDRGNALD
jgi:predicted ATP-binding protein involved in virulence